MKTVKVYVDLNATAEQIWQAWTDPTHLNKWLSETATVELKEGGEYSLTSGTPLVPGKHRVVSFEKNQFLALSWMINGFVTELSVEIEKQSDHFRVIIIHSVDEDAPFSADDSMGSETGILLEMWAYNIGLLKTYLELGDAKCRLASNRKAEHAIKHTMDLQVSAKTLFDALVVPSEIEKWNTYGDRAPEVDTKVGGNYSFGWSSEDEGKDGPDKITAYEAQKHIAYSWHSEPKTEVSWTVQDITNGGPFRSRLTLEHKGFPVMKNMEVEFNLGWACFLHCMAFTLEKQLAADWYGAL